jgi:hypothetical protein
MSLTNMLNMINHLDVETNYVMKIWEEIFLFNHNFKRSNNCQVEFYLGATSDIMFLTSLI